MTTQVLDRAAVLWGEGGDGRCLCLSDTMAGAVMGPPVE